MTPTQEDREADSGFTPENIADAEWLWTNVVVDHRKFHTLPTHHKALLCHTAQRFRLAAEERGARMALEAAAKVAADAHGCWTDAGSPLGLATAIRQIDPAQIVKGQSDAD